jgi:hypothetical protein
MFRLLALAALAGCAAATEPPAQPTQAQWDDGLRRLSTLRDTFPKKPYTQPVTVDFHEPYTRRRFEGRGAVGVDPGRAMRMILVGPAGEPALDVWVTRDAWRMVVPAIHLVRRGGRDAPASMPIGFFRSWFVDPLGGHLLALGRGGELVVRDDDGGTLRVSDVTLGEETGAHVRRRRDQAIETFAFAVRKDGGRASYVSESTKLAVGVKLGAVQSEPPDPLAFVDPDQGGAP